MITYKGVGFGPSDPKLLDDGGEVPKSQGKRLAVRFPSLKYSLYFIEN